MNTLTHSAYGMSIIATGTFEQTIERVKIVFKEHGFGALSEIDVQAALREKITEEIEPYTILGMCNPHLASRALKAEHEIGMLLPCNVLVHECGGAVHVGAQDPMLMMDMARNENLRPIAEEAKRLIELALQEINAL
jgi:uncharacterized protein (DUF302 family)